MRRRDATGRYMPTPHAVRDSILSAYLSGASAGAVSLALGVTKSNAWRLARDAGVLRSQSVNQRRYLCDDHFFDVIDTEEKAYWLGFLAADGCVESPRGAMKAATGISLHLAETDREHLGRFTRAIQFDGPIYEKPPQRYAEYVGQARCLARVTSEQMAAALIGHGVVPRKTAVLRFPTTVPERLLRHFIRGYFDGDGCWHTGTYGYWSPSFELLGTSHFLEGCRQLMLRDVPLTSRAMAYDVGKRHIRRLAFAGARQTGRIYRWIYADATVWMPRKRNKIAPHFGDAQLGLDV